MSNEREMLMNQRKKWMEQRDMEQKLSSMGINEQAFQDDKGKLLTEITLKLTEKFKNEMQKGDKSLKHEEIKIEKAISKELESNTCPICLELMLPPTNSPILLFPCGHTFCRACITECLKKHKDKCPCCRTRIGSQAVNLSLQNLICIHTNNKHLLDKYADVDEEDDKAEEDNSKDKKGKLDSVEKYEQELKLYEMRYKIVKEEKRETQKAIQDLEKKQKVQAQVVKELCKNKEEALKRLEAVQKEISLIGEFLVQAEKEQEKISRDIEENQTKIELIDSTLTPIQQEKEKYETIIKGMRNQ